MILNIRGPSGSGKSEIVYRLLRDYPSVEVWEDVGWNKKNPRCVGHLLPGGLFVVGPYLADAKTAGLDVLIAGRTELVTLWLERNCVRYPHVVFEGMTASLAIGRYHDLRKRLDAQLGFNSISFAFMDTPLEVCRERLGKTDQESDLQWGRVQHVRDVLDGKHEVTYTLDWQDSYAQTVTLLQAIGGWDPFSTPPVAHPKVRTRYTLLDVWNELWTTGYPDADEARIKRFQDEIVKHREKFPA